MFSTKIEGKWEYPHGRAVIPNDIKTIATTDPKDLQRESTINKINSRWAIERIPEDDEKRTNVKEIREVAVDIDKFFPHMPKLRDILKYFRKGVCIILQFECTFHKTSKNAQIR